MRNKLHRYAILFAAVFAFAIMLASPEAKAQSISDISVEDVLDADNSQATHDQVDLDGDLSRRYYRRSYHRRYYPRRYYRRYHYPRVYRRYYAPSAVVVTPAPVVVTRRTVVHQEQPAQQTEPVEHRTFFDIGLHASALGGTDFQHYYGTQDNIVVGGAGIYLRIRPIPHLGIELTADMLYNETAEKTKARAPFSINALGYVFDSQIANIYGAIGFSAVLNNEKDYTNHCGEFACGEEKYLQFGGNIGGGGELRLGALHFKLDARYMLLQAKPLADVFEKNGDSFEQQNSDNDTLEHAVLFTVGMGLSF